MLGREGWIRLYRNSLWRALSSARLLADMETQVIERLRSIQDNVGCGDIVSFGRVKDLNLNPDLGSVHGKLEIPSPLFTDIAEKWKEEAIMKMGDVKWVKDVNFNVVVAKPRNHHMSRNHSLSKVSEVVVVSSCKGGVGKSTVAVNLAFTMSQLGARVGILDADIYGPSLPIMINPLDKAIRSSRTRRNFVEPVDYLGVKCISFGFVNRGAAPGAGGVGAAVMRGPMISKIIDQLILGTEWGELDYLIVDMPPGTGDIQMSLSQQIAISAAVVVTTPQELSYVDVEKGIAMFDDMKIPTVAVVENMSYFDCVHGHRHYPFGDGRTEDMMKKFHIKHLFKLPISADFSASADKGIPFVLEEKNSVSKDIVVYKELAYTVAKEVVALKHRIAIAPQLLYDSNRGVIVRLYTDTDAKEVILSPINLRAHCRCGQCIDEFTGEQLLDPTSLDDGVHPTVIQRRGNYAYAVHWSDGHTSSLYTFKHISDICSNVNL